jgi:hypothetical protein
MIDLFAGTVLLGISVLLFLVLRWGSRKSQEPVWMRSMSSCSALL